MPILEIERIHLQKSQNNGKSLHPTVLVLAGPQVGQEFFIHLIDDRLQIRRTAPAAGATQRAAFTTSGNELPAESFTPPSPPPTQLDKYADSFVKMYIAHMHQKAYARQDLLTKPLCSEILKIKLFVYLFLFVRFVRHTPLRVH